MLKESNEQHVFGQESRSFKGLILYYVFSHYKDFRLMVVGSIACSGHPTSVNRDLRVIFSIVRKGNIIWEVSLEISTKIDKLGIECYF